MGLSSFLADARGMCRARWRKDKPRPPPRYAIGTPGTSLAVRIVCSVVTFITCGAEVRRCVSSFSCAVSRATRRSRKSPPPRISVDLPHLGPGGHHRLEGIQHRLLLAFQPDQGEEGDIPPKGSGIQGGVIAADHPFLLQPAHPPQAGRGRQPNLPRQRHIGDPPLCLQGGKDEPIRLIEAYAPGAGIALRSAVALRNIVADRPRRKPLTTIRG